LKRQDPETGKGKTDGGFLLRPDAYKYEYNQSRVRNLAIHVGAAGNARVAEQSNAVAIWDKSLKACTHLAASTLATVREPRVHEVLLSLSRRRSASPGCRSAAAAAEG